jgi:hypothetical protein
MSVAFLDDTLSASALEISIRPSLLDKLKAMIEMHYGLVGRLLSRRFTGFEIGLYQELFDARTLALYRKILDGLSGE